MLSPVTHDCFVCVQYLHYLKLFCRANEIEVYQADILTDAILVTLDSRRVLLVNQHLPPSEWLAPAFELLAVPVALRSPPVHAKEAHYGLLISLNSLLATALPLLSEVFP